MFAQHQAALLKLVEGQIEIILASAQLLADQSSLNSGDGVVSRVGECLGLFVVLSADGVQNMRRQLCDGMRSPPFGWGHSVSRM